MYKATIKSSNVFSFFLGGIFREKQTTIRKQAMLLKMGKRPEDTQDIQIKVKCMKRYST